MNDLYSDCVLCAHRCHVDRTAGMLGRCAQGTQPKVARAALHMWEEPPISGTRGSGTVFFSGCSLGCIYCQNAAISHGGVGRVVTVQRLSDIFLSLQSEGAHNINLVTPTHYVPSIREALDLSREGGLHIPVVYNTSSFDTPQTIRRMKGYADIYLADFKYIRSATAQTYSFAPAYPTAAKAAIEEMVRQAPHPLFDTDGMMRRGVIVRVLLLPGQVAQAKLCVGYIHRTYGDRVYISLMNQYTPPKGMPSPLHRTVTKEEYEELLTYADKIGVKNGFTQQFGTAEESFIPAFDMQGI